MAKWGDRAVTLDWLGKVKGMGNRMDERWQERRWQWREQEVLMNQLRLCSWSQKAGSGKL